MSKYAVDLRRHARSAILRFLEGAPKYTSNVSMLEEQLKLVGIHYARDQVVTEVHWLQDQGMVELEDHNGFIVVSGTLRGVEIAQGISLHPEVKRPRPGA